MTSAAPAPYVCPKLGLFWFIGTSKRRPSRLVSFLQDFDVVPRRVRSWFESGGARATHIHTSGHASPQDLEAFAEAVGARQVVPVHGVAWGANTERFAGLGRLRDGEALTV